jgi:type I restriction enzyme S subunit
MKANAEKNLNEAKALFQASLKEMLEPKEGWEEKKLDDIGELKNGMNFNKNESGYNIHILGVGDFGNLFQIDDTDCLQTISLNSNPSEEYILKNEDIVFVRSNGNKNLVGRCVLIHVGDEPCSFSGFCIRFRKSTKEVDACYLTHFLKTEESRRKLVGNGANISNLNQKVLNEFVVSYPSMQEQQSIVETLDSLKSKVDRLQENFDKISQECDALKQAILRQVFE